MSLDVNTTKGRETVLQEQRVLEKIKERWDVQVTITNKTREAAYDGMIVKDGEIKAIFEVKCRTATLDQMKRWGSWLITHEKLTKCATVSRLSTVPLLGFLYLVPEDMVLYWKITDDRGEFTFPFEVDTTETQYCVNGGTAIRENAFLPLTYSKIL